MADDNTPQQAETGDSMAEMISGGMDMISGAMKGMTGILEGIFQVISKVMNAIIDASPMLQGVLKIVDKMFKMILMPIGNLIARLLLPIAIKMANKTMQFLQKYGNAGPDKLEEMMSEGMTIALDSFTEMIGTILTKVLPPILKGLFGALVNMIAHIFGMNGGQNENISTDYTSISEDLTSLLGGASGGVASILDQFGLTVQTSNKMYGTSQAELVTAIYKGSVSIEDGFQSVHEVLVIGTTKLMDKFNKDFNTANAGLLTQIDTLKTGFKDLSDWLDDNGFGPTPKPEYKGGGGGSSREKSGSWLNMLEGAGNNLFGILGGNKAQEQMGNAQMAGYIYSDDEKKRAIARLPMASGGLVTRPTNALVGEAGPEAVIPLDKFNGGFGTTVVHVTIQGDVYGIDDLDSKIEKSVNKSIGKKVRGAY